MKDILELLKNLNKKIYISFLFIVILLNFGIWKTLGLHKDLIIKSSKLLLHSAWSIIFLFILLICIISLLKKSDRESKKKIDEYLYKPCNYQTEGDIVNANYTKVYREKSSNEIAGSITITINNISKDKVDYLKGLVYFYKDKTRVKKLDFEIFDLNAGFSEQIFKGVIKGDTRDLLNWDFFELFILELKDSQRILTNKTLKSNTYYNTHYFILNIDKFYDYRILGFKLKYNLAWIKQKLRTEIIPRVKFLYQRKTYYIGGKVPLLKGLFELIQRFIAFTFVYVLFFLFILLVIYSVYDIYNFVIMLFKLWKPAILAKI